MIQIPVVEIALLKFICLLSIVHASDEVIQERKILELILEKYNLCKFRSYLAVITLLVIIFYILYIFILQIIYTYMCIRNPSHSGIQQ